MSGLKALKDNTAIHSRIKKIMQSDEDVGRVAKASPVLIATALEIFMRNLLTGASSIARSRGSHSVTSAHIKAQVQSDPLYDFCQGAVASVADLPPEGSTLEEINPKRTRKPKSDTDSSRKKTKLRADSDEEKKEEELGKDWTEVADTTCDIAPLPVDVPQFLMTHAVQEDDEDYDDA